MVLPPEPRLSSDAYAFLASVIHRRSRIQLGPDRQSLVVGRLAQRLATVGCDGFDAYCRLLATPAGEDEVGVLIDLITTNHTHFFREPGHFRLLEESVLPALGADHGGRPLQVWSAAASSGEEPYSLAVVLSECERSRPGFSWRIHATDISSRMLERCRNGIYEVGKVTLPQEQLRRYFLRGFGVREGFCRVRPELRSRVSVQQVNLFQPDYPVPGGLDVIFCRNAMIYFDAESRQELLDRLVPMLAPGGFLFVGHAESLLGMRHPLEAFRPSVYRRPA